MKDYWREFSEIKLPRWEALTVGSEQFTELEELMLSEEISTIHLTENWTTTWAEQAEAIQELVRIRNDNDLDIIITVDAVSSQMFWRLNRNPELLPDVIYWWNQKDTAIGSWGWNMLFNNRALARTNKLKKEWLDTWWKLSIWNGYWKNEKRMTANGQTMQTPAMEHIFKQLIVYQRVLWDDQAVRKAISESQHQAWVLIKNEATSWNLKDKWFELLTKNPESQSKTTHVIKVPEWIDAKALVKKLMERWIEISAGYWKEFGPKEIRICFYSANKVEQMQELVNALKELVVEMR